MSSLAEALNLHIVSEYIELFSKTFDNDSLNKPCDETSPITLYNRKGSKCKGAKNTYGMSIGIMHCFVVYFCYLQMLTTTLQLYHFDGPEDPLGKFL